MKGISLAENLVFTDLETLPIDRPCAVVKFLIKAISIVFSAGSAFMPMNHVTWR